ncbi:NrsF family protein [Duganella levis]|uniref:DUF1109 family protein n=1 Tax=Duganella levis TaxID=2692169 RepID=A0ABW9VWE9_9BURK|nr:NrsF family protein [Duganella levis]MYN25918.1 DUF1109 family protein [Duganella levis]
MNNHDALIERLSRDVTPVKRPASPWQRALGWMLVAMPCGFLASLMMPSAAANWADPGALWAGLGMLVSLGLGVFALKTAFALSIAGHKLPQWRWLAAFSVVWLLVELLQITSSGDPVGHFGDGIYCYTFMMIAGIPMVVVVVAALRLTRSLYPAGSLAIAGLGIAAMSQIILGFCHPVAGELMDLLMHLAAAITLIAIAVLAGRRWIAI